MNINKVKNHFKYMMIKIYYNKWKIVKKILKEKNLRKLRIYYLLIYINVHKKIIIMKNIRNN